RAEGAEQDRQFIGRGEGAEGAEHGFAANGNGVIKVVHPPDHQIAQRVTGNATDEGKPADHRTLQSHRLVQAVERVGSEHVPFLETGVANLFGSVHGSRRRIELGDKAVNIYWVRHRRSPCRGFGWTKPLCNIGSPFSGRDPATTEYIQRPTSDAQ